MHQRHQGPGIRDQGRGACAIRFDGWWAVLHWYPAPTNHPASDRPLAHRLDGWFVVWWCWVFSCVGCPASTRRAKQERGAFEVVILCLPRP